jgi:hypothetical protein
MRKSLYNTYSFSLYVLRTPKIKVAFFATFVAINLLMANTLCAQTDKQSEQATETTPLQIEVKIMQKQNGVTIEKDTVITYNGIPDPQQLFNELWFGGNNMQNMLNGLPNDDMYNEPLANPMPVFDNTTPNRGFLGVCIDKNYHDLGVKIERVTPNSAAYKAGLSDNDLIYAINGIHTNSFNDLRYVIEGLRANDTIMIDYSHKGESRNIEAILQAAVPSEICHATPLNKPAGFPLPPHSDNITPSQEWQNGIRQIVYQEQCQMSKASHCGRTVSAYINDLTPSERKQMGLKPEQQYLCLDNLQINFDRETHYISFNLEIKSAAQTDIRFFDQQGNNVFTEKLPLFGGTYRRTAYLPKPQISYYLVVNQADKQYIKRISLQ